MLSAEKETGKAAHGTLWEAEPIGLGHNAESIQFTQKRMNIYNKAGGRALMGKTVDGILDFFRNRSERPEIGPRSGNIRISTFGAGGSISGRAVGCERSLLMSLHFQPRLSPASEPIALHFMYRPNRYEEGAQNDIEEDVSVENTRGMLMAYINYHRVRGINPVDIKFAEDEIKNRLDRCDKIVLPPTKNLPDVVALAANDPLLRRQIFAMYKVDSLADARKFYDEAISGKA